MNGPLTSCDTFAALRDATASASVLFGKNSDRPDDEAQRYVVLERAEHPAGATLRTQYLEIPQAARTYKAIGGQPHWLWGFEQGINEWGVAIGNEAVYTRVTSEEIGLLGMDLVRIGVERAQTAVEAVKLMGALIEEYGIGGSARYTSQYFYDNGFLICDPHEVWHMETAGKHWAARRLTEGEIAISNEPTIGTTWDLSSAGLDGFLVGLGGAPEAPDFGQTLLDRERPRGQAVCRRARGSELLARDAGQLAVPHFMALLRDHYDGTALAAWTPEALDVKSICMHSTPYHQVQTAGSIIAELKEAPSQTVVWLSVGQPCRRIFLPFTVEEATQEQLDQALEVQRKLEAHLDAVGAATITDEVAKVESGLVESVQTGIDDLPGLRRSALEALSGLRT